MALHRETDVCEPIFDHIQNGSQRPRVERQENRWMIRQELTHYGWKQRLRRFCSRDQADPPYSARLEVGRSLLHCPLVHEQGLGFLQKEFRSEEHTSELQSLMRISYAVFCLKKKNNNTVRYEDTI